jgi:ABC-type sugar transport system permease subunit
MIGVLGETGVVDWLGDPSFVIFSIIFMGFPWIGGTSVLIYMSGLMNISGEIIESSLLDGANTITRIIRIDIPMIIGQIRYFLIFGIIGGLQDYGVQIVLTKGGPGYSTMVPGYYMFTQAFDAGRMGYASAIGTVMFFVIFIFTMLTYRFVKTKD